MKLRPHHLLCTQTYKGNGYSENFVRNMNIITDYLRYEPNAKVDIVFSTDSICSECPSMLDADVCEDNEKVKIFDKKIADYFGIEEKGYVYKDLIHSIHSKITAEIFDDICSPCSWYPSSGCKDIILNSNNGDA